MDTPLSRLVSRRVVLGGAVSALVLAACGSDDDGGSAATTLALDPVDADAPILAPAFNNGPGYAAAGIEQRLTWSLREPNNAPLADPPDAIGMALFFESVAGDAGSGAEPVREPVGDPIEVVRHDVDIPIPYYPLRFTPEKPGFYTAVVELDGHEVTGSFQVSDPAEVTMVEVGAPMKPLETPTVADARGVDPICTLDPPCPFHETTVAQALAEGRPLALIISTPAFCQTDICGPVLDLVVAAAPDRPDIAFVHAEVYNQPLADPADPSAEGVTAAVTDLGLTFEPTLYLADSSGTVAQRLDNIYDAVELGGGLDLISPV